MKAISLVVSSLTVFPLIAFGQIGSASEPNTLRTNQTAPTAYGVVSRDANSTVWERTVYEQSPSGESIARKHRFTELATGLNFRDEQSGQWLPSKDEIAILADGTAAATNGQHKVYFPNDIYNGVIELIAPGGNADLKSRPLCLSYFDGTNNVLIAQLTNSVGLLVGSNQIVYTNVFTDIKADLRYTYTKAGLEQDVVLHAQPPGPQAYGLNPNSARLELLTEFFGTNDPRQVAAASAPQNGLTDTTLAFGRQLTMVRGKAFSVDDEQARDYRIKATPTYKNWLHLEGRTFLSEDVPYPNVATELDQLPALTNSIPTASLVNRSTFAKRVLPPLRLSKVTTNNPVRFARLSQQQQPAFVLDYVALISNQTNFTFQADTTYYIDGEVDLFGTTTIEGGTVVKYTNSAGPVVLYGPVDCQTTEYRPAVFTAKDDDSVGETISGSTGSPLGTYAGWALLYDNEPYSTVLHDLRFEYANWTLLMETGSSNVIRNVQFLNDSTPLYSYYSTNDLQNALMANVYNTCFYDLASSVSAENLTAHGAKSLWSVYMSPSTLALTNSLLISVTNLGGSFAGDSNATNSSDAGVFQIVGGGCHYLAADSPYRNIGTTNIDPGLLGDLAQRTTYPPVAYTNVSFSSAMTLSPQASRDTDTPDLGYHYDPLDYSFGGCIANSNLTFTAGTAVGWFRTSSGWYHTGYGIHMGDGITLSFNGTVSNPAHWLRLNTVQENDTTAGYGPGGIDSWTDSNVPTVTGSFLKCSAVAGESGSYFADDWGTVHGVMNHSEFWGGNLHVYEDHMFYTNCLMWRVPVGLDNGNTFSSFTMRNCTLWRGSFNINRNSGGPTPVSVHDCAFDGTTITTSDYWGSDSSLSDYDYNAYTNSTDPFSIGGTHDVVVTNFNWQAGWFGNFYLPNDYPQQDGTLLIDTGETTADQVGLYHFTTQTNQYTQEYNSQVDIGYHYVAIDGNNNPLDSDNDGIPDYIEDANGNGIVDSGETDWQNANDNGLTVHITRPRNGSTLP